MNDNQQLFPAAYFITFTCYGARLHGNAKGTVDRLHNTFNTPYLKTNPGLVKVRRKQMSQSPYELDYHQRKIVLLAIQETCQHFDWHLFAAHIRTNHVHIIVGAEALPKTVMTEFKARASWALNKVKPSERLRKRWTRGGSMRYIWPSKFLISAMKYVVEEQGAPMSVYYDSCYELNAAP